MKSVARPKAKHARSRACPMEKNKLALRFYEAIPSTLAALEGVVERLVTLARDVKCDHRHLERVELALREALANAVIHGNRQDPGKKVVVRCFCQPDRGMLLVVEDEGSGFDPAKVPNPTQAECLLETHGRGLFLMHRMMDRVRISRRGTRVTMLKRLESK